MNQMIALRDEIKEQDMERVLRFDLDWVGSVSEAIIL
jgi:hypothetical protein